MNSLKNKNILKLVFKNFDLFRNKQRLVNTINNRTIFQGILRTLSYQGIYKSMGRSKHVLKGHPYCIDCVALLPNGNLISSSSKKDLQVWDINNYQEITTLTNLKDRVCAIVVLKDGNIVSFSYDGEFRVWNHNNDYNLVMSKDYMGWSFNNSILLENGCLACSYYISYSSYITIIDPSENYKPIKTLEQSTLVISLANIGNDKFASGDWDGVISLWDINNDYSCFANLLERDGPILAFLYIDSCNLLLSGSGNYIKVWNLFDNICVNTIEAGASCLALLKGGYFTSSFENIKIWDIIEFKCVKTLEDDGLERIECILSLDDYRLVSTVANNLIIWNY
jgi:WD40 repeat protein